MCTVLWGLFVLGTLLSIWGAPGWLFWTFWPGTAQMPMDALMLQIIASELNCPLGMVVAAVGLC